MRTLCTLCNHVFCEDPDAIYGEGRCWRPPGRHAAGVAIGAISTKAAFKFDVPYTATLLAVKGAEDAEKVTFDAYTAFVQKLFLRSGKEFGDEWQLQTVDDGAVTETETSALQRV